MDRNIRKRRLPNFSLAAALALLLSVQAFAGPGGQDAQADAAASKEEPFLGGFIKETRILYPLAIGHWKAAGEQRFDTQEAGVDVRYADQGSDRWVDVYIYPVGALTDDQLKMLVGNERDGLISYHLPSPGAEPATELRRYDIPRGTGEDATKLPAFSLDLGYEAKGAQRSSAMVLVFDRLYMVKARYDILEAGKRAEARRELEEFTAALMAKLGISSYGSCWSPLPIEQLPEGRPAPEGSIMSMQTDGVTTEYVYADRVLAKDPKSTGAQAAALLGMAMQDRMYDGCDGDEPSEPEVAEEMREIRIEYHPPTTQNP
jgi:hypothetical protein